MKKGKPEPPRFSDGSRPPRLNGWMFTPFFVLTAAMFGWLVYWLVRGIHLFFELRASAATLPAR